MFPSKREQVFGHSSPSVLRIILIPWEGGTRNESQKQFLGILGKFLRNSWGMHNLGELQGNVVLGCAFHQIPARFGCSPTKRHRQESCGKFKAPECAIILP